MKNLFVGVGIAAVSACTGFVGGALATMWAEFYVGPKIFIRCLKTCKELAEKHPELAKKWDYYIIDIDDEEEEREDSDK